MRLNTVLESSFTQTIGSFYEMVETWLMRYLMLPLFCLAPVIAI